MEEPHAGPGRIGRAAESRGGTYGALDGAGSRVLVGETEATPSGGNNPLAEGRWTLVSRDPATLEMKRS